VTLDERAFYARRAIESLRSGVPNSTAVDSLGIHEPAILAAFGARLDLLNKNAAGPISGFFIEGDFGSGKSHILRFFESQAAKRRLATSSISISKETPLGDLPALFRAAVSNLSFPDGRLNGSLAEVFEQLDTNSGAYASFFRSVCNADTTLDPVFQASIMLYDRYRGDPDIVEQLVEFWNGGPPQFGIWKKLLKEVDAAPIIRASAPSKLAMQRFQFVSLALKAAGFSGWLITIDEIELIAKFTLRGRTQAYVAIDRLFSIMTSRAADRLVDTIVVGAITADLVGELLYTRRDQEMLPQQLSLAPEYLEQGAAGLNSLVLTSTRFTVGPLSESALELAYESVRNLYISAFASGNLTELLLGNYEPSLSKRNMRQNVRGWISSWDLKRLDPSYDPMMVTEHITYDLSEDRTLEGGMEQASHKASV